MQGPTNFPSTSMAVDLLNSYKGFFGGQTFRRKHTNVHTLSSCFPSNKRDLSRTCDKYWYCIPILYISRWRAACYRTITHVHACIPLLHSLSNIFFPYCISRMRSYLHDRRSTLFVLSAVVTTVRVSDQD